MKKHVACKAKNDTTASANQARERVRLPGQGGYEVEWDMAAPVTSIGALVYFAQYLAAGGLFDAFCADSPLHYTSPNAPTGRDVLGTMIVSILNGQTRYAHIGALRGDRVSADIIHLSKFVSEDSVRRGLLRGQEQEWDAWLSRHERAVWEPLLVEPYVLDIDNTVKSLYGHQEGAEKGYNPQKHGRPSHNYHTYFVGSLRLVLGVDVHPGKEHTGGHGMPGLWRLLDSLPAHCRPQLLRGDIGYGNEKAMVASERRGQPYLFKIRQTTKVRNQIEQLERMAGVWHDLADGWQGTETRLTLSGWTGERRCILVRRPADNRPPPAQSKTLPQTEFTFVQLMQDGPNYEYMVLVTNTDYELEAMAQLYRDRADCENVFDEIKNQWGWAGYVTRDLRRCRIMARLIALVYNWWNIFTRLAQRDHHMEAITSRPMLLHAVGRLITSGRRKILRLTSTHAYAEKIRDVLCRIGTFLNRLTAEQLTLAATWAFILSTAFAVWLRGKPLRPIAEGSQILLHLQT
jgi:hypothetical protein